MEVMSCSYGLCPRTHSGRMRSGPEVRQHPTPVVEMHGDWGHMGISPDGRGSELLYGSYGFGNFHKNSRPWWFDERDGSGKWLHAQFEEWEPDTSADYAAANSSRFEHGQSGAL